MADEYIKRSDAIDYIEDFVLMNKYYHPYSKRTTIPIAEAIARINETPSADVVEVVRCKDCRHRDPEDHKCDCGQLERAGCVFPVNDDYFCAYGER